MVSLTTHIKSEIRVVLFTELRSGREHTAVHTLPVDKGDSVIARELKAILMGLEDNWIKANGKPVANKELWQQVMRELEKHTYKAMLKE